MSSGKVILTSAMAHHGLIQFIPDRKVPEFILGTFLFVLIICWHGFKSFLAECYTWAMDKNELKKWKLHDTKKVFVSKWLSLENRSYEFPDGSVKKDYLHLNRPDYVLV